MKMEKSKKGKILKNIFGLKFKEKTPIAALSRLNTTDFGNSYLLDNFEWFFVGELGKWGLEKIGGWGRGDTANL